MLLSGVAKSRDNGFSTLLSVFLLPAFFCMDALHPRSLPKISGQPKEDPILLVIEGCHGEGF